MVQEFVMHWPAFLVATVAGFVVGWLWYGPLLGKKWAAEMNMPMPDKPEMKGMMVPMVMSLVGTLFTVYVMMWVLQLWMGNWRPDEAAWMVALWTAIFLTVGFVIPAQLGRVAWEKASWPLYAINVGYGFVYMLVIALILAFMM